MNKVFVLSISLVAALGGLLFGFDTAIISGAIPFIKAYFQLNEYWLGWTVGSILLGCAAGAIGAGRLSDHYGRRSVLVVCAILFAVSGIGAGLSNSLFVFILFRMIGGLGVGAAAMVAPMYIAEIAPAAVRGRLVALYQLAIVMGILLAYYSNFVFLSFPHNWRWMFASQGLPAILFLMGLVFVPESPRWLIKKQRKVEAARILKKTTGEDFARELSAIELSFLHEKVSLKEIFSSAYFPLLLMGILIAVFQQVTGINAILYYAPVIFKETGLDSASSLLQTIGIGFINVLATFIAIVLVDRVGRKTFLVAGSLLMGLSLLGIAFCFKWGYFDHYLVLVFTLIYVASFGCTLGAVTWVYLSEIFPNRIRSLALSIATLSLWLADFGVTYSFPVMTKVWGTSSTLFFYASFCGLAFIYMLFNVKETKNKTLEEIETIFIKKNVIR